MHKELPVSGEHWEPEAPVGIDDLFVGTAAGIVGVARDLGGTAADVADVTTADVADVTTVDEENGQTGVLVVQGALDTADTIADRKIRQKMVAPVQAVVARGTGPHISSLRGD